MAILQLGKCTRDHLHRSCYSNNLAEPAEAEKIDVAQLFKDAMRKKMEQQKA